MEELSSATGEKQGEQGRDQPLEGVADPADESRFLLEGRGGREDPRISVGGALGRTSPRGLTPLRVPPWTRGGQVEPRPPPHSAFVSSWCFLAPRRSLVSFLVPPATCEHILQGA